MYTGSAHIHILETTSVSRHAYQLYSGIIASRNLSLISIDMSSFDKALWHVWSTASECKCKVLAKACWYPKHTWAACVFESPSLQSHHFAFNRCRFWMVQPEMPNLSKSNVFVVLGGQQIWASKSVHFLTTIMTNHGSWAVSPGCRSSDAASRTSKNTSLDRAYMVEEWSQQHPKTGHMSCPWQAKQTWSGLASSLPICCPALNLQRIWSGTSSVVLVEATANLCLEVLLCLCIAQCIMPTSQADQGHKAVAALGFGSRMVFHAPVVPCYTNHSFPYRSLKPSCTKVGAAKHCRKRAAHSAILRIMRTTAKTCQDTLTGFAAFWVSIHRCHVHLGFGHGALPADVQSLGWVLKLIKK